MARNNVTLDDLVAIATRVGVKVVVAPSSHRGKLGRMGTVVGLTRHHTGTANTVRPTEDFPDYAVVKEGRPGLENSLSAFGLGRREAIYVFSEYLSWHAGTWNWQGITDGNGHFLGIEAAGVGDWTDWQRDVYPRLCASILLFLGEGIGMMPRHADGATPAGRKTDMANEWPTFVAEVAHYLAHPEYIDVNYTGPEEDDDDMNSVKIIGIKDADPAWGGYWAVNMATFQAKHLNGPQFALYGGGPAIDHKDQGRDILSGFEIVPNEAARAATA